ncbi:MAG: 6-bladed beta-propeller [Candidatus Thiodiazotropha taylori]|nr:6-bladed beta-propeller [Candidatus Thiodiazotropha taylori]
MSRLILLTVFLFLTACSSTGPVTFEPAKEGQRIVWPSAPEPARIEFITAFSNAQDLGIEKSIFSKLLDLFTGADEQNLARPYALAVFENRLAIADPDAAAVHLYDLNKQSHNRIERVGESQLESPISVAIDNQRLFIADSKLNKVFVLDSSNQLQHTIDGLERPTSLSLNPSQQQLFIADTLAHKVLAYDLVGNYLFKIGERGENNLEFNYPSHLASSDKKLFVNDTMNFRVQVFDSDGQHRSTFGKQGDASGYLTQSKGIAVDSDGHIYIADALANRVQIFTQNGEFLLEFGNTGRQPGEFQMPTGLAIWNDKIFVADSYNQRIQVFQYLKVDE